MPFLAESVESSTDYPSFHLTVTAAGEMTVTAILSPRTSVSYAVSLFRSISISYEMAFHRMVDWGF